MDYSKFSDATLEMIASGKVDYSKMTDEELALIAAGTAPSPEMSEPEPETSEYLNGTPILNERSPIKGRAVVKNFANDQKAALDYLRKQNPHHEIEYSEEAGEFVARPKGKQAAYKKLDPENYNPISTGFWKDLGEDVVDLGYDTYAGVTEGLAGLAGGIGGGMVGAGAGAIPGAMAGAGAASAGNEAVKHKIGKALGLKQDVNWGQVGMAGGIGAASAGLFGAGKVATTPLAKKIPGLAQAEARAISTGATKEQVAMLRANLTQEAGMKEALKPKRMMSEYAEALNSRRAREAGKQALSQDIEKRMSEGALSKGYDTLKSKLPGVASFVSGADEDSIRLLADDPGAIEKAADSPDVMARDVMEAVADVTGKAREEEGKKLGQILAGIQGEVDISKAKAPILAHINKLRGEVASMYPGQNYTREMAREMAKEGKPIPDLVQALWDAEDAYSEVFGMAVGGTRKNLGKVGIGATEHTYDVKRGHYGDVLNPHQTETVSQGTVSTPGQKVYAKDAIEGEFNPEGIVPEGVRAPDPEPTGDVFQVAKYRQERDPLTHEIVWVRDESQQIGRTADKSAPVSEVKGRTEKYGKTSYDVIEDTTMVPSRPELGSLSPMVPRPTEITNKQKPDHIIRLQQLMAGKAEFGARKNKVAGGAKAKLDPLERETADSFAAGRAEINRELERLTGGESGIAKASIQEIIELQNFLGKYFKDEETTLKTLRALEKNDRQIVLKRLKQLDQKFGTNIVKKAKLLQAVDLFRNPSTAPVSSGGTTSTSRSTIVGGLGGGLGWALGHALAGSPGGFAGAAVGGGLANYAASPAFIKKSIMKGKKVEALGKKIPMHLRRGAYPAGTMTEVLKNPWQLDDEEK